MACCAIAIRAPSARPELTPITRPSPCRAAAGCLVGWAAAPSSHSCNFASGATTGQRIRPDLFTGRGDHDRRGASPSSSSPPSHLAHRPALRGAQPETYPPLSGHLLPHPFCASLTLGECAFRRRFLPTPARSSTTQHVVGRWRSRSLRNLWRGMGPVLGARCTCLRLGSARALPRGFASATARVRTFMLLMLPKMATIRWTDDFLFFTSLATVWELAASRPQLRPHSRVCRHVLAWRWPRTFPALSAAWRPVTDLLHSGRRVTPAITVLTPRRRAGLFVLLRAPSLFLGGGIPRG